MGGATPGGRDVPPLRESGANCLGRGVLHRARDGRGDRFALALELHPDHEVSADGDYTVVFEFGDPYAPFLTKLSGGGFVVPEGAAESADYDIAKQSVGSGAFVFEETVAQTRTTLTKFEEYWETDDQGNALPYLDEVVFKPMPEGQSRINAIQTGEVDLVVVPRSQARGLEGASGVVFSNKPGTFYDYFGQNTTTRRSTT